MTTKKCTKCGKEKGECEFSSELKHGKKIRRSQCRECRNFDAANRRWKCNGTEGTIGRLATIRKENKSLKIIGKKRCSRCNEIKLLSEFSHDNRKRKDGNTSRVSWCKGCLCDSAKKWFRENKFRAAIRHSKEKSKKEGYVACTATELELLESFTGRCDICGVDEFKLTKRLHMEHCHKTGKFRGWVCNRCNHVLGLIGDSSELANKISKYLIMEELQGAARPLEVI